MKYAWKPLAAVAVCLAGWLGAVEYRPTPIEAGVQSRLLMAARAFSERSGIEMECETFPSIVEMPKHDLDRLFYLFTLTARGGAARRAPSGMRGFYHGGTVYVLSARDSETVLHELGHHWFGRSEHAADAFMRSAAKIPLTRVSEASGEIGWGRTSQR